VGEAGTLVPLPLVGEGRVRGFKIVNIHRNYNYCHYNYCRGSN
jgi:hypothetical protein